MFPVEDTNRLLGRLLMISIRPKLQPILVENRRIVTLGKHISDITNPLSSISQGHPLISYLQHT